MKQDELTHWAIGSSSDEHKYYARIETGKGAFGTKKYRYFYSPDEYKSYLNSVDGSKNKDVLYKKTEFYDTNKAIDSYYDTVSKTNRRYQEAKYNGKDIDGTDIVTASKTYKKLSDDGKKTVDDTAAKKGYQRGTKQYIDLVNLTYELEKEKNYTVNKLNGIEKHRDENDAIQKRVDDNKKKRNSLSGKAKRATKKIVRSAKKSVTSLSSSVIDRGKEQIEKFDVHRYWHTDEDGKFKNREYYKR